jgi:peroxiredoxin family protein
MVKKLALIASKGTLDWAYPPFILASTAAALDYEISIFFTFYGLTLLKKDLSDLKISPLANPAMPKPIPMPSLVQILPGMEPMATMMMKQKICFQRYRNYRRITQHLHGKQRQADRLSDDDGPIRLQARRIHR